VSVTYRCTRCRQSVTLPPPEPLPDGTVPPRVVPTCCCGFTPEGKPRKPAQAMTEEES